MGNEFCCQQQSKGPQGFNKNTIKRPQAHQVKLSQEVRSSVMKSVQPKSEAHYETKVTPPVVPVIKEPVIDVPILNPKVRQVLNKHHFFQKQFNFKPSVRKYGNDIYEGQLNEITQKPDGYGKMYKDDQSHYVGQFHQGKASGQGAYILPDGSYYQGDFKDNQANASEGHYYSDQYEYTGGFLNNAFHGNGKEKGPNHEFTGEYVNNRKKKGIYKWTSGKDTYIYNGTFNVNEQFNGQGNLDEPQGSYHGDFLNGHKHGYGIYKFKNGLRYEGQYRYGVREGKGTIYNHNNTIAYEGQMKNGTPNGTGFVLDTSGNKVATKWIDGIDERVI